MRRGLLALMALAACGTDTTVPKPNDSIVGHNRGAVAIAISSQNSQTLFLQVEATHANASLRVLRSLESDGSTLEDFTGAIPARDFTGGTKTGRWALHTDIPEHGLVDLNWTNTKVWVRETPFSSPVPGTSDVLKLVGRAIVQGPTQGGVSGTVFGQPVGVDPLHGDAFGVLLVEADVAVLVEHP